MNINDQTLKRLIDKDASLWSSSPDVQALVEDRLGWLDCLKWYEAAAGDIDRLVQTITAHSVFEKVLLLGMGGSSLAPETFALTMTDANLLPIQILDSTHPNAIAKINADLSKTLFIVSSKSGSTLETVQLFKHFYQALEQQVDNPGQHFIAITDPGSPLIDLAEQHQFRHCFLNPSDIGGRYSALSYFGLVPAALSGIDLQRLMQPVAELYARLTAPQSNSEKQAIVDLANAMVAKGADDLVVLNLSFCSKTRPLFAWIEQLVAESTGKAGKGVLPCLEQPVNPDNRAQINVYIGIADSETSAAMDFQHQLPDIYHLGAEFFRWQVITALATTAWPINPFDEPNVSEAKASTMQFFQDHSRIEMEYLYESALFDIQCTAQRQSGDTALVEILSNPHYDYLATLAYLEYTDAISNGINQLNKALCHAAHHKGNDKLVSTLGFGPRYLHSTGQLHKGGPDVGVFLQIVDQSCNHAQVAPFSTLIQAQADGDLQVLTLRDRPCFRVLIKAPLEQVIEPLCDYLISV